MAHEHGWSTHGTLTVLLGENTFQNSHPQPLFGFVIPLETLECGIMVLSWTPGRAETRMTLQRQ